MQQYKFKIKKGIDDLKGLYAFVGNSQGDTNCSNSITDYLSSQGWMSFVFDCELTDQAIQEEILKRKAWNEQYIQDLKESNEYGQEVEYSMNIEHNSLFDKASDDKGYPLSSYRFIFLD
jgi:hypothetical protein